MNEINFKLNINNISSFFPFTPQAKNFSTSTKNNIINPEAEKIREEALAKPLEAGCFNYTHINNLGRVNEFYSSDSSINSLIECTNKLINRLKDYFNELPKDKVLFILPVIR